MKYFSQHIVKHLIIPKVFLVMLVITMGGMLVSVPAQAAADSDSVKIRQLLEERDKEVKDLLGPKGSEYTQEQRDRLKDMINNIIDYRTMAKNALETTYDTLSKERRENFVDLFSRVVRDQSLNKLDIYRAEVTYQKIAVDQDSAYVKTMALLDDARVPVDYRMQEQTEGWVITDMVIDEVSTVDSYRRSFQNIIRKKGFDTLMETLRKRVKG
mgnify:CR=1 FL=1